MRVSGRSWRPEISYIRVQIQASSSAANLCLMRETASLIPLPLPVTPTVRSPSQYSVNASPEYSPRPCGLSGLWKILFPCSPAIITPFFSPFLANFCQAACFPFCSAVFCALTSVLFSFFFFFLATSSSSFSVNLRFSVPPAPMIGFSW